MTTEKSKKKCPHCNKGILENRTQRPIWMKLLLFWLPIKRYKCSYCNKKSYIYGGSDADEKSAGRKSLAV